MYFHGLTEEYPEEFSLLAQIINEQVFELWKPDNTDENCYCVTYMFNDAVESYLTFHDATLVGTYEDNEEQMEADLVKKDEQYGLVVRQGTDHCFTLWFSALELMVQAYCYDGIGHFWVEGAEHLRQLIYRLCIVQDKYEYFGDELCTKEEIGLLPLLEFGPLRRYYSVPWEKEDSFSTTVEGIQCFLELAKEANDTLLVQSTRLYGKLRYRWLSFWIYRLLNRASHEVFYELLRTKINTCSQTYDKRSFGLINDKIIESYRREVDENLKKDGFSGDYPQYWKRDGKHLITAYVLEEQPFTMDKQKKYRFHTLQSTIQTKNDMQSMINAGFFRGSHRHAEIITKEIQLS